MFRRTAPLFFTMSLLSLIGCSPRSTDLPASLTDLQVEISIEDITERTTDAPHYSRKSITAVLRHARGRAIERGDVKVEVNGVPMEFRVSTGNYYDRHPFYRLAEDASVLVTPATEYRFALVLPDGIRHEVGTVRTPAALNIAQFDFPPRRRKGEISIGWRELAEPAALTLFRSDTRTESDGTLVNESGSANDPAALRRQIGAGWFRRGSDQWKIPADFSRSTPGRKLAALGAEIRVVHETRLEKKFAKGSTLRAERRLTLRMECAASE
jgi:hypothetical protein